MIKYLSAKYFVVIVIAWLSGWYAHKWFVYLVRDQPEYINSTSSLPLASKHTQVGSAQLTNAQIATTDSKTTPFLSAGIKTVKGAIKAINTTAHKNIQNQIDRLLKNGTSDALIDYFEELNLTHEEDWHFALTYFKQQLFNFLQNGQSQQVINLGIAFTNHHHDDAEISQLIADAYLAMGDQLQAIKTYYAAKLQIDEASELERVTTQIHQLVYEYHSQLEQQEYWSDLLSLYEYLVGAEPDYAQYYFAQAKLLIRLKDYSSASHSLAYIVNDSQLGTEATKLADYVERAMAGEARIPITQRGSSYLVPARLNRAIDLMLLIDTGASISAISAAKFQAIGGESQSTFVEFQQISTANGVVKAPLYRFKQLTLGNQIAEDVSFIVINNFRGADGLLGMNVLEQFNFHINQEEHVLLLNQGEF